MAALGRMYSRLISCRHHYASFNFGRNAKCLFQTMTVQHSSLSVSSPRGKDADDGVLLSQKVFTRKDFVNTLFIGKDGKNIKRLKELYGREFKITMKDRHILVSGTDAEGLKRSVEKVTHEVQRIEMLPKVKVLTDEDAGVHRMIFRRVYGEKGKNIKRLISETDIDFHIFNEEVGCIVVHVARDDFEDLKMAEEIIKQEVQRAKNQSVLQFTENVLTDEDADVHDQICEKIIGKGGHIIKYWLSKLGPNINVTFEKGQIFVSGSDAEEVQRAVEIFNHEVKKIKGGVVPLPFTGKVLTDEDADFHRKICGRIIGKGGENIKQLTSELGSHIEVESKKLGHIVVGGTDAKDVETAVEFLKHEVLRAKRRVFPQFTEKVLTNEDADVHSQICRKIIGKGGENIKQLKSEIGPFVYVDLEQLDHIVVSGNDAEEVQRAVEILKQEVQNKNEAVIPPFTEKVLTHKDVEKHKKICGMIIGKGGQNMKYLSSKLGPNIRLDIETDGHIVVSGTDAAEMEKAVEILKQEVQNKNEAIIPPFTEKVLTDKDTIFHYEICGMIIGKGGQNIKYLLPKLWPNIGLDSETVGHIVVSGTDAAEMEKAVEILKQEVQNIKDEDDAYTLPFTGKVLTDEDADCHRDICGRIIGKGGDNIKKLTSELLGPNIRVHIQKLGHILISGTDAEEVERAVEILKQEVQRGYSNFLPFTEKVFTIEDAEKHHRICRMVIGKGGHNITKLDLESDIHITVQKSEPYIDVSGTNAEMVEKAVEKVKLEVQKFKDIMVVHQPFFEEVTTDEDDDIHNRICGRLIGKGGHNLQQMKLNSGLNFTLDAHGFSKTPCVCVYATSMEVLEKAVEVVKHQIETVRKEIILESCKSLYEDWHMKTENS